MRVSHENRNIMHSLHRTESELLSARAETKRCKDEIAALREKMKSFHTGKIAADQKVAETSTVNSRLEVKCELCCTCFREIVDNQPAISHGISTSILRMLYIITCIYCISHLLHLTHTLLVGGTGGGAAEPRPVVY